MEFNVSAFMESLSVMGLGMLGIFVVVGVIMGVMYLLNAVFKDKRDGDR